MNSYQSFSVFKKEDGLEHFTHFTIRR